MIKVALVGVGNCASSLIQGKDYYHNRPNQEIGLMHKDFGGYKLQDISFVAAFDIDKRKVGNDLTKAIFAPPNCADRLDPQKPLEESGVIVQMGHVLDGVASHMTDIFKVSDAPASDVVQVLRDSGAEILINYLPVGSAAASRFYADCCLEAGVAFINAIPEFICSDDGWIAKFKKAGLPCAGDDIKSQVGATILHRSLAKLVDDRGQLIENTYQLNIGGNTDFENMIDETRLISKRKSKTQAVTSILSDRNKDIPVKIGPSDHVSHLGDNKVCYINIKGKQFGDVPFEIECKLSVQDSPNSAGVMVDAIRGVKIALDRGLSGNLEGLSSYLFKSPRVQFRDDKARQAVENFIHNPDISLKRV